MDWRSMGRSWGIGRSAETAARRSSLATTRWSASSVVDGIRGWAMEAPMPDMTQPGAHLESCLDDLKCRAEECRAESRKQATLADAYEQAARKLERAMREETEKARVPASAPGSPAP